MRARHGADQSTTSPDAPASTHRRRSAPASRVVPAGIVAAGVAGLSLLTPLAASAAPVATSPSASVTPMAADAQSSASASTSPQVAAAQQQLAALQERASRIDSDYVKAQVRLDAATADISRQTRTLAAARQQVGTLQRALASLTLTQVQPGLGAPVQLVAGADSASLTLRLGAARATVASASASLAHDRTVREQMVQLHAHQQALATVYEQRIDQQQKLVDQLTAPDQAALQQAQQEQNLLAQRIEQAQSGAVGGSAQATTAPTTATAQPSAAQPTSTVTVTLPATSSSGASSATGRVAAAINFAMAQQGKAYVMGATGPSAYDCSGLMLRAWEAAGLELPRTSQEQITVGTPVNTSDLQPGDLVFYYPGVTHVGMYIGNGLIINAENSRVGIVVTRADSMPIVGARRIA